MSECCNELHHLFNKLPVHQFPFEPSQIPLNGIYVLFEEGESAHGANRIVRIGTHTGNAQLRSRLRQHFVAENKDRSIFRKNIGRALLNKAQDPFLEQWQIDLTTRAARAEYAHAIDFARLKRVEQEVTAYIQKAFKFVVFPVGEKNNRLDLESKLISTVSLCNECLASDKWLGQNSPVEKIRQSSLWLVNELYKTPFSQNEVDELRSLLRFGSHQASFA